MLSTYSIHCIYSLFISSDKYLYFRRVPITVLVSFLVAAPTAFPAISLAVVFDFLPVTFFETSVPIELVTLVTAAPRTAPNIPLRRPPLTDFFALPPYFAAFSSATASAASCSAFNAASASAIRTSNALSRSVTLSYFPYRRD